MRVALSEAKRAFQEGEVPVGAVVIKEGKPVASAYNMRLQCRDILAHAEVLALRRAARKLGDWRLGDVTVYVTLEPCPMCVGVMLQGRVRRLVYGAPGLECGAAGTVLCLADYPGLSHRIEVRGGVLAKECAQLLKKFFQLQRDNHFRADLYKHTC